MDLLSQAYTPDTFQFYKVLGGSNPKYCWLPLIEASRYVS